MSSKFDHKKVMPRYSAIAIIMTIFAIAVVGKALYIMTAKHDYWMKVAERQKKDSVTVKPNRGNILSCTGQLMASSLPEFKVFMEVGWRCAARCLCCSSACRAHYFHDSSLLSGCL